MQDGLHATTWAGKTRYHFKSIDSTNKKAKELAEEHNYTFVHAYNDYDVICGQGTIALEILEELDIPATIFVTTENLYSSNIFWWDELEEALLVGECFPKYFRIEYEKSTLEWKTETFSQRKNCYKALHFLMKNCIPSEQRSVWLDLLWKWGLLDRLKEEIKGYFTFMTDRTGTLWEVDLPTHSCNHGFASYVAVWLSDFSE